MAGRGLDRNFWSGHGVIACDLVDGFFRDICSVYFSVEDLGFDRSLCF